MKRLCHYISEYMGVLVLASAALALFFPDVLGKISPKVINYLLGLVMFARFQDSVQPSSRCHCGLFGAIYNHAAFGMGFGAYFLAR